VIPARAAQALTTYQTTFWVIPFPHTVPFFRIERNSRPLATGANSVQWSTVVFTQAVNGPYVAGFPYQIDNGPMILQSLNIAEIQGDDLGTPETTPEKERHDGSVTLVSQRSGAGH
jgi:hypothetical protein